MAKDTSKKLTVGNPMRLILGFMIPVLIGMLFQQFYSLVDTVIVGKALGVSALAAVGSTGSITFLTIGFCNGVASGFAIPVAQRFGAEDHKSLRRYVTNSAWLAIILSLVMTVFVSIYCREILILMQTPEDILDEAYAYLLVIFLGIPVTYLYNLTSGIIRSLGDSKTPVYFLLLASALNIVLDLVFILGMKTGVGGAAVATVISQAVSGILCLVFMIRRFPILKMEKGDWKLRKRESFVLLSMGLPMGLQYSITGIGSVVLQASVNTLGSMAVAVQTASGRLINFFAVFYDAIGSTMATYGGQNVGAGKLDHLKAGLKAALIVDMIYAVIAWILLYFFSDKFLLLFLNSNETVIMQESRTYMLIVTAFFALLALVNTFRFLIQGMGYSPFALLAGIAEMIARILVAFTLVPVMGIMAAAIAGPIAWLFADAFLVPAYFWCCRHTEKKLGQPYMTSQKS